MQLQQVKVISVQINMKQVSYRKKIVSEKDQEIPQSQSADKPMVSQGRATQQSRDTRRQTK